MKLFNSFLHTLVASLFCIERTHARTLTYIQNTEQYGLHKTTTNNTAESFHIFRHLSLSSKESVLYGIYYAVIHEQQGNILCKLFNFTRSTVMHFMMQLHKPQTQYVLYNLNNTHSRLYKLFRSSGTANSFTRTIIISIRKTASKTLNSKDLRGSNSVMSAYMHNEIVQHDEHM